MSDYEKVFLFIIVCSLSCLSCCVSCRVVSCLVMEFEALFAFLLLFSFVFECVCVCVFWVTYKILINHFNLWVISMWALCKNPKVISISHTHWNNMRIPGVSFQSLESVNTIANSLLFPFEPYSHDAVNLIVCVRVFSIETLRCAILSI